MEKQQGASNIQDDNNNYLGLNEHHEKDVVLRYMRFMRYQRMSRVRSVEGCFEDFVKLKRIQHGGKDNMAADILGDGDSLTKEVVEKMMEELKEQVKNELETELLNAAHTNVLLLRQMCEQAENWHLKLTVNISELENKDLLNAIQKYETDQFDFSQKINRPQINVTVFKKLAPLDTRGDPVDLLRAEIDRLKADNIRQKSTIQKTETQVANMAQEKQQLAEKLSKASLVTVENLTNQKLAQESADFDQKLKIDNDILSQNLQHTKDDKQKLEENLINSNKKLLKVQEQLEMAEKELEKKFVQTKAYANMKRILAQKNQQIKSLRRQVGKVGAQIWWKKKKLTKKILIDLKKIDICCTGIL